MTICQISGAPGRTQCGIHRPQKRRGQVHREYVRSCQDLNTGGFRYQPNAGPPGFARTEAVVAALQAGIYEGDDIRKGSTS
ncbi:MAG: hypothetical protein U0744_01195 [Gemmataceae bacterium]